MDSDCYLSSGEYPEEYLMYLNYLLDHLGLKELGTNLSWPEVLKILDGKRLTFSSNDGSEKELLYPNL